MRTRGDDETMPHPIKFELDCLKHIDQQGNSSWVPLLAADEYAAARKQLGRLEEWQREAAAKAADETAPPKDREESEGQVKLFDAQAVALRRQIDAAQKLDERLRNNPARTRLIWELLDITELMDMEADDYATERDPDGGEPRLNVRKKRNFLLGRCVAKLPAEIAEDDWERPGLRDAVWRYLSGRAYVTPDDL